MTSTILALRLLGLTPSAFAQGSPAPSTNVVQAVSPALARYTQTGLLGEVGKRPGLSPRDRSIVTAATLVARSQTAMPFHLARAMDTGLPQEKASEAISQIAFYAGWPNAFSAMAVAKGVFDTRAK